MSIRTLCRRSLAQPVVLLAAALFFAAPCLVILGQMQTSGFLGRDFPVPLLFWPGRHWGLSVWLPAWLSMGLIAGLYLVGIGRLAWRRRLGSVVLYTYAALFGGVFLKKLTGFLTGWTEQQAPLSLVGKVDRALFSGSHNALWEECVFRGIPLLLVLLAHKKWPRYDRAVTLGYFLIPSVAFAVYHVPNHGAFRLVDTFFLGLFFAYVALRHGLLATYVIHFFANAGRVWSLGRIANLPVNEIAWLAQNGAWLRQVNTVIVWLFWAAIPLAMLRLHRRETAGEHRPAP